MLRQFTDSMQRWEKIPFITVRSEDRATRNLWSSRRSAPRNENIDINENLPKQLKRLRWHTKRGCARKKASKYVWIQNGRVLVRKSEGPATVCLPSIGAAILDESAAPRQKCPVERLDCQIP